MALYLVLQSVKQALQCVISCAVSGHVLPRNFGVMSYFMASGYVCSDTMHAVCGEVAVIALEPRAGFLLDFCQGAQGWLHLFSDHSVTNSCCASVELPFSL